MALSLLIIGATLSTGKMSGAYAATVFIFVYDSFFALGWLGITWVSFYTYPLFTRRFQRAHDF